MTTGTETLGALRRAELTPWADPVEPESNLRSQGLRRTLDEVRAGDAGASPAAFDTVAMVLVDAVLDQDEATLSFALDDLKQLWAALHRADDEAAVERRGRLAALADVARWSVERTPPTELLRGLVRAGSHAFRMLEAIDAEPGISNTDLTLRLGVGESEISRCGRRLIDGSLAVRRQVGKRNAWTLTPRGKQVVAGASSEYDRATETTAATRRLDELMAAPVETAKGDAQTPPQRATRVPEPHHS
jgi:hypothetical protein